MGGEKRPREGGREEPPGEDAQGQGPSAASFWRLTPCGQQGRLAALQDMVRLGCSSESSGTPVTEETGPWQVSGLDPLCVGLQAWEGSREERGGGGEAKAKSLLSLDVTCKSCKYSIEF